MREPEKVSEYPRPPRIETINGSVIVEIGGEIIAEDNQYIRVCETFHPPGIYINPKAFCEGTLKQALERQSFCEWKGFASYWHLSKTDGSDLRSRAGWSYSKPSSRFKALKDWISIYPSKVDACKLEGELVTPQPGLYYGGWITSWIVGPFKGDSNHPELI